MRYGKQASGRSCWGGEAVVVEELCSGSGTGEEEAATKMEKEEVASNMWALKSFPGPL